MRKAGRGGKVGGKVGGVIRVTIGVSVIASMREVPQQKRLVELLDLAQHSDQEPQLYRVVSLILPYVQDRKTPQLLASQQVVLLRLLNLLVELRVVLGDETQAETVAMDQLGWVL